MLIHSYLNIIIQTKNNIVLKDTQLITKKEITCTHSSDTTVRRGTFMMPSLKLLWQWPSRFITLNIAAGGVDFTLRLDLWHIIRYHYLSVIFRIIYKLNQLNPMEITGVLQPQKRNKELTDKQIKNYKSNLQSLKLSAHYQVYYCLGTKDSKSGFFSNDRLLVLNTKDRYLGYVSKIPSNILPFFTQQQVKSLKFKSKVSREDIVSGHTKDFKCHNMPGKISTFEVFYKKGNRGEIQQWVMQMGNAKVSSQFVDLINQTLLKDDTRPKSPPKPQPEPVKYNQPVEVEQPKPRVDSRKILNQNPMPQTFSQDSRPPLPPLNSLKPNLGNLSFEQHQLNSSRIANLPYNDHVSQLKYLRKQKPSMFNISNQLSHKKLPSYQPYPEEQIQNNKNNLNAMDQNKFNFSKKPSGFIKQSAVKKKDEDPYMVESQALQNSQLMPQYGNKSKNRLGEINNSPPIQKNDEYSRYNSQYSNQFNKEPENIQPVYRSRQSSKLNLSKSNKLQKPSLEDSRPKLSKPDEGRNLSNADEARNITIQNRNSYRDGAVTRMESQRNNFVSNQSNSRNKLTPKAQKSIIRQKNFNNSKASLSRRKWNQIFAQSSEKLQIYEEFIHSSFNIVREIVNQLALDQNRREYLPMQLKPPYFTYYNQGIIIVLHQFDKNERSPYPQNAPLLYDQSTYQALKRQFYNYNSILSITANEGFIKVPLCSYFEYKGVIALCKAEIPQNFSQVTPKRYQKQFDIIQNQLHTRFMYGSFNSYLHPSSKYIILQNMRQFIPEIPLNKNEVFYFRKEFLNSYQKTIQDREDASEANDFILQKTLPQVLSRLQSIQTYIVNSTDLARILHEQGLSLGYLLHMVQQTRSSFLKRIFLSELVSIIFSGVFRSQINNLYNSFPLQDHQDVNLDSINSVLIDSCHALLQMMFSYSNNSQSLWKIMVQQCKTKYKVSVSKQDLIPGYLLGSICERIGIVCDFRRSSFDKHKIQFFAKEQNLPRDLLAGFKMKIRRYDLSSISVDMQSIQNILYTQPTAQNFKTLINLLNLKQEPIPNYLEPYEQQILAYLCNFVPYSQHEQFQHIGIYNMVLLQPHSFFSTKCSLLAIKWCIKKRFVQQAIKIYQMKQIQNAFWLGQYNPAISQFYDFFSMYYASVGKYEESIQLAKLSLKNTMKIVGAAQIPVADKHYQLGNIYFKMGRKQESLKEYSQTKDILTSHHQTTIAEYAVILLKLSLLYLNFGKIVQAINHSLQALKIFDTTQASQQDQIGTYQILSRCYQITKKQKELQNIGMMVSQRFNQTQDHLIFQRMAKLSLYIQLKNLSSAQSKAFLTIISKLEQQAQGYNEMQAFSFLHRKATEEVLMTKIEHYLQNIVQFYQEISKKDLFRRYKSLDQNTRSQAQEMLVILQSLGVFIGFGYLMGSLKETYE